MLSLIYYQLFYFENGETKCISTYVTGIFSKGISFLQIQFSLMKIFVNPMKYDGYAFQYVKVKSHPKKNDKMT